jgi:hypothetical protein
MFGRFRLRLLQELVDFLNPYVQIYLHTPNEAAYVSDVGFAIVPGQHSLVTVDYSEV